MRQMLPKALLVSTILNFALPAIANDSSAELGAGGLVLTKNADIEMRREDLYISARQVRVKYVFFNRASRDVTIRVAFPMPDVEGTDDPQSIPTEHPTNILGFNTIVNGKPVTASVEQKVFVAGVEQTALLQSLGIPLAPHIEAANRALEKLPKARLDELEKLKLIELSESDSGQGMKQRAEPRWTLKTTWHWEQTFRANAETFVEHSYQPATGASAGTSLGSRDMEKEDWFRDYRTKYCLDRDFINTMNRARISSGSEFGARYTEQRIAYILTTGANWAGPIGDFRLVIDKGAAQNIVSFCGEGVKKISPTQFEIVRKNFTPAAEINVLIMRPMQDR